MKINIHKNLVTKLKIKSKEEKLTKRQKEVNFLVKNSKWLKFKSSTGDIICKVDLDNISKSYKVIRKGRITTFIVTNKKDVIINEGEVSNVRKGIGIITLSKINVLKNDVLIVNWIEFL